jgi:hypothetical protein
MTGWLKGRDEESERRRMRRDAAEYVPRSVRPPDAQRLAPADLEDEAEGPDADLAFLASLASEAIAADDGLTSHGPPEPTARPAAQDDDLRLFKESRLVPARRVPPAAALAPDVEIADLVEDLSTVAAALRLRKAA